MSYTLWRGAVLLGHADAFPDAFPADTPAARDVRTPPLAFRPTPAFDGIAAVFVAFQAAADRTVAALATLPAGAGPAQVRAALAASDLAPAGLDPELQAVAALGLTVRDPDGRVVDGVLAVVGTSRIPVPNDLTAAERAEAEADAAAVGIRLFDPQYVLTLLDASSVGRRAG